MAERNPYAPSRATLESKPVTAAAGGPAVWRDGNEVVMLPSAPMPHRCVKCNQHAVEPMKNRKIFWHHPALYLLLLFNVILYAIVAAIVRKKAIVGAGLCAAHLRKRRLAIALGWIGFLSGFVWVGLAASNQYSAGVMFLGVLLIFGSIIAGIIFARIVYAKRIDKEYVRLRGCGHPFLASLPPFPG